MSERARECVCEREREREGGREGGRERERERGREGERERERDPSLPHFSNARTLTSNEQYKRAFLTLLSSRMCSLSMVVKCVLFL